MVAKFTYINVVCIKKVTLVTSLLSLFSLALPLSSSKMRDNYCIRTLQTEEFVIDTNIVYVPVGGSQEHPSMAFDGENYLVVWQDLRNSSSWDIYGARVNASGIVFDHNGFPISIAMNNQLYPSIAFDGTNFLVAWEDWREGASSDIYCARVTPQGIVLDPSGIAISIAEGYQRTPAIAFDGINSLVIWEDYLHDYVSDILGSRMNPSGIVIDTIPITITNASNLQKTPAIAFDGTNYLAVWQDARNIVPQIYGSRVTPSGTVLDPSGIEIYSLPSQSSLTPALAFDSTNYLVVWQQYHSSDTSYDITGTRVTPSGIVIDTAGINISTAPNSQGSPSVSFDGTNLLVSWYDGRVDDSYWDIYCSRVNTSGVVLDTGGIAVSTALNTQGYPATAFDGTNYLVIWQDLRNGLYADIYGTRLNQSGIVLDTTGIAISTVVNSQRSPIAAFDGTNYFVVWQDNHKDPYDDILGMRINQSGNVFDSLGIIISNAVFWQTNPSIAFDDTNYFVVWSDERSGSSDIFGTRVNQLGIILDSIGISISDASNSQKFPSLALDGTNYFAVWQDWRNNVWDIYGARVNTSGIVFDSSGIPIATSLTDQLFPSIAFDGINYFIVWQEWHWGTTSWDIYGIRVDQTGTVIDTPSIAIMLAPYDQKSPDVTFDGTNYLVVWQDTRNDPADVYGARVNQTGVVLDTAGIVISDAENRQQFPTVAFDGTNYLVIWQDLRNSSSWDIYGAKVSTDGIVLASYLISDQTGDQITPSLTRGNNEQILITFSGWVDSIHGNPVDTMRIWGKIYPFIGLEEHVKTKNHFSGLDLQIYPNPVQRECHVRYTLHIEGRVQISMFDVTGRLVRNIDMENQKSGDYCQSFYVPNLSQGVYFIQLETPNYKETEKLILLK